MTKKVTILIVEDEESISNFMCTTLNSNGYETIIAKNENEAERMFFANRPDIVILDLGLPDKDGVEFIKIIRNWSAVQIIVVTARCSEEDKVEALDIGADDYITKPFGISELLARIRTALRHAEISTKKNEAPDDIIRVKDLTVDLGKRTVVLADREIHFTQIEFRIVTLLCKYAGRVVTYDFIIRNIWGSYALGDNQALRVNMANIRRKLEENPADPKYIMTELGVGYRLLED